MQAIFSLAPRADRSPAGAFFFVVELGRCCRRDATLSRGNVPGIEGIDMNALWTFEGGHLVTRNQAGAVLWAWLADEGVVSRNPRFFRQGAMEQRTDLSRNRRKFRRRCM